jgi:hypothetical protein
LAFTPQDPKIREVLGFGGPDTRLEEKLMTVVAGPDPVNTTFLNFMAVQDDTVKVGWGQATTQERRGFVGRHYVAQAGLKFRAILLSKLLRWWDYKHSHVLMMFYAPDPVLDVGCGWASPSAPFTYSPCVFSIPRSGQRSCLNWP